MLRGLSSEGKGLHKQWEYSVTQLNDLLSAYGTIQDTATASIAMDLAVQELSSQLKCERDKW